MYWMLPLSSRIAPANMALPLKYFKQNLPPLLIPFYRHMDYNAKQIKATKKSKKQLILLFYLAIADFMD